MLDDEPSEAPLNPIFKKSEGGNFLQRYREHRFENARERIKGRGGAVINTVRLFGGDPDASQNSDSHIERPVADRAQTLERTYLYPEEIISQLEEHRVVKTAPHLAEQALDSRLNEISYADADGVIHTVTEEKALRDTTTYLKTAVDHMDEILSFAPSHVGDMGKQIASMGENLTFIGEKEYQEATAGIALYWKALLEKNPDQQILPLAGVSKTKDEPVKSDDFLLDSILSHFSDEEVEKYRGRLITDPREISAKTSDDLRVILVDDWTLSGAQLKRAATRFRSTFPQFASSVEIQLIAADDERIQNGLHKQDLDFMHEGDEPIPIRAYFRAHTAQDASTTTAHITGSHSSVDFGFQDDLEKVAHWAKKTESLSPEDHAILDAMPPLTRIVRPYRSGERQFIQKARFQVS